MGEDSRKVIVLGTEGNRVTFMRQTKDTEDTLEEETEVKNWLNELGCLD